LAVAAALSLTVFGQDSSFLSKEPVKHETKEIDLAKISLESTEVTYNLARDMRKVISDAKLAEIQEDSDYTLSEIDSLVRYKKDSNLEMKNIRSIRNHINYWKQKLLEIQTVDSKISSLNKELDKSRLKYARELAAWNNIQVIATEYKYEDAVMGRINKVIQLLDTSILILGQKSNITMGLLDRTGALKVEINERIDMYDSLLIQKQKNILRSGHPSLFQLDYTNAENWKIVESVKALHKGEFQALGSYFKKHSNTLIFHLALLILAIIGLVYIKRAGIPEGENEDINYRRSIKIIVSNPGNSALILVLFASTILYPNKPVLFLDMFRLIVSVPLAIMLLNMAHRKYWPIIISFEVLLIIQIINTNLPTHLILARFLLLLTAFMEIVTLVAFIYKIKGADWHHPALQRMVKALAYIHLVLAALAVFTNITGKVLLTQSLLNAVTGIALATILIFLAMLVGNGLFMLFIDSRYSGYINVISRRKSLIKDKVTRTFQFLAGLFMLYYVMEAYGFDIYAYDWLARFFTRERTLGSLDFTWGKVFIFFFVIWVSVVFSKFIRIFLEEEVLDRMGMSKGLPNTISLLVRYTLIAGGVIAAISAAGLRMTNLTIILGAMSVGIGFGLQNIFNNLVSGLILLLERPIKIGDTIEVGSLIGVVKHIGIRASNVQTVDGAEIIVPNGNLISNEVINWTLTDQRRRIEVLIGVAYGSDPYKVQKIFMDILSAHPEVVAEPKPIVLFNNFGDSSLDFRLLFWTENFDEWIRIRSEVIFQVFDGLKEAGIEIPFPQHDLHIRSVTQNITPESSPTSS
jgi:small-conductance mechanosensitive channel